MWLHKLYLCPLAHTFESPFGWKAGRFEGGKEPVQEFVNGCVICSYSCMCCIVGINTPIHLIISWLHSYCNAGSWGTLQFKTNSSLLPLLSNRHTDGTEWNSLEYSTFDADRPGAGEFPIQTACLGWRIQHPFVVQHPNNASEMTKKV